VKILFNICFILVLIFIFYDFSNAQEDSDINATVIDDSCLSVPVAITRSLLIPGMGQLYQERLGHAAFFYGTSAIFYYNTFFYLYRYTKTDYRNYYNKFRSNLSAALFFHLLNIIDVSDAAIRDCPTGWQGGLLSDNPVKSPWGATLRSGIFPGWGQLYNESYLKAAGYLLVDGYLFYKIRENDIKYRDTKNTNYRDKRSKYSWYFGVAYMLTMADAYAGAYLYKFDESMKMTILPEIDSEYIGIQLNVRL
jgi:hypothetical protein